MRRYLPSVMEHTPIAIADVVVADNGSTDASRQVLAEEFAGVKTILFDVNHGFAEGYNLALKWAYQEGYQYTVLLNSDVGVKDDWLTPLYQYMEAHDDVGACQPKILSAEHPDAFEYAGACGGYLDRDGYPYCRGRIFSRVEKDNGQYDTVADVFWASGAALMVRTKEYLDAGGLDSKFFAHMEEIDLCWRLKLQGRRIVAVPQGRVYHLGGGSLPAGNPRKTYLNFRNNLLMMYKNLPENERSWPLIRRRLLDTLAWGLFVVKLDWKNAGAVIRAHRDFARMRHEYTTLPVADRNLLRGLPSIIHKAIFTIILLLGCLRAEATDFTVLQWNIWQEGTQVAGGYDAIIDEIERLQPDFVTLSEVRNYHDTRLCDRLTQSLAERGLTYYSQYSYDTGLLSRHPIKEFSTVYPCEEDHGSAYRMVSELDGQEVAIYTAHLDYLDDAYYNVRGYDGSTWEEIPVPTSVEEVLERNDRSHRPEAARAICQRAREDAEQGHIVIVGGDFNEPSHLDWTEATAHLWDHNGLVVPWTSLVIFDEAGWKDAYREAYPDPVSHPGFTFPADNPLVAVNRLTWAPKADERERIDYILYLPAEGLGLQDIKIFGPEGAIAYSERRPNPVSGEPFILPLGVWPTDHKGLLATFTLNKPTH